MLDKTVTTRPDSRIGTFPSKVLAFVFGLSVSTGVIYLFQVGNTPVYIGYCAALLIAGFFLLKYPRELRQAVDAIDNSLLTFCGLAALSLIPSLAHCLTDQLDISAPLTVVKGLVVLLAGVIVYLVAIVMRRQRGIIVSGVALGIIVNAVFSALAQRAFNSGSVFSLIYQFPQNAFIVPLKWGVSEPVGSHAIYSFRAQGLFLEPSHLMVFLVAWSFVCFAFLRHTLVKLVLVASVVYMSVQAFSPNIALLFLELALGFLFVRKHPSGHLKDVSVRKRLPHATLILAITVVFICCLAVMSFSDEIFYALESALISVGDMNPFGTSSTGTAERFSAMLSTVSVLLIYPFGSGWNTESVALMAHYGSSVYASHSFALRLLLELGPLGLFSYCWLIWRHAKGAFCSDEKGAVVAVAVVCMTIAQFMNGITLLPYVWLLLGLSKGVELDGKCLESGEARRAGRAPVCGLPAQ